MNDDLIFELKNESGSPKAEVVMKSRKRSWKMEKIHYRKIEKESNQLDFPCRILEKGFMKAWRANCYLFIL